MDVGQRRTDADIDAEHAVGWCDSPPAAIGAMPPPIPIRVLPAR